MPSEPTFSIVMPTRERGHLLQHALASALAQTFDDFEIVVCDNASTDDTENVVRRVSDRRVRYHRAQSRLSMVDNWELACSHATGKFVTILSDDDAFSPRLLETIHAYLIKSADVPVVWDSGTYYHPDWPIGSEARRAFFSDKAETSDARTIKRDDLLDGLFSLNYNSSYPRLLNSCCSREILARARTLGGGRLFFPTCPDYSVATLTLMVTSGVVHIPQKLMLFGMALATNGSYGFPTSDAIEKFMAEFGDLKEVWRIPLVSPTAYNQIAVTLLALKRAVAHESLASRTLDVVNLFVRDRGEISLMASRGSDTTYLIAAWEKALAQQPTETREAIGALIAKSQQELQGSADSAALRGTIRTSLKQLGIAVAPGLATRFAAARRVLTGTALAPGLYAPNIAEAAARYL